MFLLYDFYCLVYLCGIYIFDVGIHKLRKKGNGKACVGEEYYNKQDYKKHKIRCIGRLITTKL